MSILTTFFNLIKPAKTDGVKVQDFNDNMDIIDTEMHKPPLTINGIAPDPVTRNTYVEEVPLADNLASDISQISYGDFIQRISGGGSPIADGDASLVYIKGNLVRDGYVAETIDMTVSAVERQSGNPITATIDRDTFVAYVSQSGTVTLVFTTAWSANPADYGITVTGTPVSGDVITVEYVKEVRGTITTANPTSFVATGWNLFSQTAGYAKVVAYSNVFGYRIGGNYTTIKFAATLAGEQSTVAVTDGLFNVAEDGYVFLTGADATTYIYPTWSDWTSSYSGTFESYTTSTVDITAIMANFTYGLCAVGNVHDEINFSAQKAVQRVTRIAYSAENLASVVESGVAYIYDENYIYAELETPVVYDFSKSGKYTVCDHGIEYFTGTTIPVSTEILYGENLKDKLRMDVLTISPQTLSATEKTQVHKNIECVSYSDITGAYVINGNTVPAGTIIPQRFFLMWNNELYQAKYALLPNSSIVSSGAGQNVEKVGFGGLNAFWAKYLSVMIGDISLESQSYYSLASGPEHCWLQNGYVVTLSFVLHCTTAYTNHPGVKIAADIPPIAEGTGTYWYASFPPSAVGDTGRSLRICIGADGCLYARHGQAGKDYDIVLTYITSALNNW